MEQPAPQTPISRRWALISAAILLVSALMSLDAYKHLHDVTLGGRDALLRYLPSDSYAAFFIDFQELRGSPFMAELYQWIPKYKADPEYAQFVHDAGFDYERDLRRFAMASVGSEKDSFLFAIADGNFDRQRIENYATRIGRREKRSGYDFFSVPLEENAQALSFTFLDDSHIALSDSPKITELAGPRTENSDSREWETRFARLAGSPIFAVIRHSSTMTNTLPSQAPSGFQSPQLSTLLGQLQWITLAGKPDGSNLRVVVEGESISEQTIRQLADLLNGMLLLAQAGLNGPQIRQQLDPRVRDAYLELARSAEVSRIRRGETQSLRLVIDITPKFLDVAGSTLPARAPVEKPGLARPENTKPTKGAHSRPK